MLRIWRRLKFVINFRKSIPFIKDFFISKDVSMLSKIISIVLFAGYILFPFDLIPDFLLILGIFDDVFVAGFILQQIVKMAPESLKRKYELIGTSSKN
ncbi:YkvA family protein [Aquibacillus kalidii]|uniref:YkvA family protein n=1 Tax=Aquibacillus kalidii TaxID=2762597 RepID=UPI0016482BB9|nr:DUF1232 domain-containing protein [Aquibacillus kalidii]